MTEGKWYWHSSFCKRWILTYKGTDDLYIYIHTHAYLHGALKKKHRNYIHDIKEITYGRASVFLFSTFYLFTCMHGRNGTSLTIHFWLWELIKIFYTYTTREIWTVAIYVMLLSFRLIGITRNSSHFSDNCIDIRRESRKERPMKLPLILHEHRYIHGSYYPILFK